MIPCTNICVRVMLFAEEILCLYEDIKAIEWTLGVQRFHLSLTCTTYCPVRKHQLRMELILKAMF